jgi:hypothetical protein
MVSFAQAENCSIQSNDNFLERLFQIILTGLTIDFNRPASTRTVLSIVVQALIAVEPSKVFNEIETTLVANLKCLLNHFFLGSLWYKGVCPHSNQEGIPPPLLDVCHFKPFVE